MTNLEITGHVHAILPLEQGVSRAGNAWKKQSVVIETDDQYPKKVSFTLLNDNVDRLMPMFTEAQASGDSIIVSFDVESREYNGRWYSDIKAYKVVNPMSTIGAPAQPAQPAFTAPAAPSPAAAPMAPTPSDDLPF